MRFFTSLLFSLSMILSTLFVSLAGFLVIPFPFSIRYRVIRHYARFNLWALRVICGINYEVSGTENIPEQTSIVLSKHQSTWETLAFQFIFPPQVYVIKRELLKVPFFGWALAVLHPIAIDRKAGRKAVNQVVEQGIQRLQTGKWVVIFPEGTRMPYGTRGRYKKGGALLAEQSGNMVIPVAHNSGKYWQKKGFIKTPGTIKVVIGPPINPQGQTAQQILSQAEEWIEATMATL